MHYFLKFLQELKNLLFQLIGMLTDQSAKTMQRNTSPVEHGNMITDIITMEQLQQNKRVFRNSLRKRVA